MTTKEVSSRFMELAHQNKYDQIQEELYAAHCESIEPASGAASGMLNASGIDAIKEKGKQFNANVEEMHGGYVGDPIIVGNYFTVPMGMDVTLKGAGRVNMDEIAVYEVKDGKITKEQFFY
jgi:hypothetical protein